MCDSLISRSEILLENKSKEPLRDIGILQDVELLYRFGNVPQEFMYETRLQIAGVEPQNVEL